MRNKLIILGIFAVVSCKAQQEYPLSVSDYYAPSNSYFKDTNNELNVYIGTWNADFQGKKITLIISKEIKRPYKAWNKNFFQDLLLVRYDVKDSFGNSLQSTLNNSYSVGGSVKNIMVSTALNLNGANEISLVYSGGNCSVGIGDIIFKKINDTQFYWSYYPRTTTRNNITCPPNLEYKIYLPETENLVFTKQ